MLLMREGVIRYSDDFETTTNPEDCRVWAWGSVDIDTCNNFRSGNDINSYMEYCKSTSGLHYFHNLKFDGDFIINWLYGNNYAYTNGKLKNNQFTTLISDMGQFYSLKVKFEDGTVVEYWDSLKILNMPVAKMSKAFGLNIEKLEIDYDGNRPVGYQLTDDEYNYLRNDCLIVALSLKHVFGMGLDRMTAGGCALHNYKEGMGEKLFGYTFPVPSYDKIVRKAYKGGYTYLKPEYVEVDIKDGITLDVNSLYPSVMYYELLPYGEGKCFKGKYEQDNLYCLYIQKLSCQFGLKPNHLPTIQIKGSRLFGETEYLTDSGDYEIELTLTNVDLEIFLAHYDVYNITWLGGYKFKGQHDLFRNYIDYWYSLKEKATLENNQPVRTLCKLMLNSLYGKFGTKPEVGSKVPIMTDNGTKFTAGEVETGKAVYIPMAAFITAYARRKTITSGQLVYDRFVYSDTDSLHLLGAEIPKELDIDPVRLGAWKHESTFRRARFLRQKCYAEEIETKKGTIMDVKCAGLPDACKGQITWDNFCLGAEFYGKLRPVHVRGGTVLVETTYKIKK